MKEHRHAEVLRAIADGKEVQCKVDGSEGWVTIHSWKLSDNPLGNDEQEWRVKPDKPEEIETYIYAGGHDDVCPGQDSGCSSDWKLKIKVIWDGETGLPKSAELL